MPTLSTERIFTCSGLNTVLLFSDCKSLFCNLPLQTYYLLVDFRAQMCCRDRSVTGQFANCKKPTWGLDLWRLLPKAFFTARHLSSHLMSLFLLPAGDRVPLLCNGHVHCCCICPPFGRLVCCSAPPCRQIGILQEAKNVSTPEPVKLAWIGMKFCHWIQAPRIGRRLI